MHAEVAGLKNEAAMTCADDRSGRDVGSAKPSKTETAAETSFSDIEVPCSNKMRPCLSVNKLS